MTSLSIFNTIKVEDIKKILQLFEYHEICYSKGRTVISNINNSNQIGILKEGSLDIITYDMNGNKVILDTLEKDELFGSIFSPTLNDEAQIITTSTSTIIFIDLDTIIDKCTKNNDNYSIIISNMFKLLSNKLKETNNRIDLLSKRTIREKLLKYFELESIKKASLSFTIPFSYTSLADYLSIDRSAMMREIKSLKNEGFLKTNKRKVTLIKY